MTREEGIETPAEPGTEPTSESSSSLPKMSFDSLPELSLGELLAIRQDEPTGTRRRKKGPKPAVSAFGYFCASNLEAIVKDLGPDVEPGDICKIVLEKWTQLTDEQRKIYEARADKDLERYERQLKPKVEETDKKSKKRKCPEAPKHPKSAYLFFVAEHRDTAKSQVVKGNEKSFTAIARHLGERWKSLSGQQRLVYQKLAEIDKERYRREKQEYATGGPLTKKVTIGTVIDNAYGREVTRAGAEEVENDGDGADPNATETAGDAATTKPRRRKHPLAPKHPLSAYLFFVATHRAKVTKQFAELSFTDIAKMIGDVWKDMTAEQRRKYEILASVDKMRYGIEMQAWAKSENNPINEPEVSKVAPGTGNGETSLAKRLREREAAQTISSLAVFRSEVQKPEAKAAASSTGQTGVGFRPAARSPPPPEAAPALQYGGAAYLEFAKVESSYILSVDPDIDVAELDAALRLTWMEMSVHEKMAFDIHGQESDTAQRQAPFAFPARVADWSTMDIASYVADSLGFEKYRDVFLRSGITGADLHTLTTARLKKEFLIDNLGERKLIKIAFDDLVK
ncbi:HMG box domain-containing protein [Plasmodiophora brassicae]|uniref:HMG box domain-containing protein n=1 Tax=Plasmodiophora brassicae TaxID=37360 RepID=A0A0G4IHT9_PLABS|nr:hypothetical protein PBRA_003591 [Plasmodiophora brassicae]SPQ98744.1 unnamed protein product [Plasmodiophora brassicae]